MGLTPSSRTLLQSGNLVFECEEFEGADLERRLEDVSERRFGFRTDYMVRDLPAWDAVIAGNPFRTRR